MQKATKSIRHIAIPSIILAVAICLYIPFIENKLIFDDNNLFGNTSGIFDFAIIPINGTPRTLPYFTLAFTEIIWGNIIAHRIFSLLLHAANALLLYHVITELLSTAEEKRGTKSVEYIAGFCSIFFVAHPIATYGAAYLAQRTILFATFFSLCSVAFYFRAIYKQSITDGIVAVLMYFLAVLSKEHAITLPLAACLIGMLPSQVNRRQRLIIALYLIPCSIGALYIFLRSRNIIGSNELSGIVVDSAIPDHDLADFPHNRWILSAANQAGEFFRYIYYWLTPDSNKLSIDIRTDLARQLGIARLFTNVLSYMAFCILAARLLFADRFDVRLIGFGLAYLGIMFLTEFSSIRFQEPFVLYRSYLWAPGLLISIAAGLAYARPANWQLLAATIALSLVLAPLSINRLESMKDNLSAWRDAAEKLDSPPPPGADRIFFNLGNEYLKRKDYRRSLHEMNLVIETNPRIPEGYIGKGMVLSATGNAVEALHNFDIARKIALDKGGDTSRIDINRAILLMQTGDIEEARVVAENLHKQGYPLAEVIIRQIEKQQ